jgi:hypothetical protein
MFRAASQKEISSRPTFSSNVVVPVIKIDVKCSCDSEVRYFGFNVPFRNLALQELVKRLLVTVQKNLLISMSRVI